MDFNESLKKRNEDISNIVANIANYVEESVCKYIVDELEWIPSCIYLVFDKRTKVLKIFMDNMALNESYTASDLIVVKLKDELLKRSFIQQITGPVSVFIQEYTSSIGSLYDDFKVICLQLVMDTEAENVE